MGFTGLSSITVLPPMLSIRAAARIRFSRSPFSPRFMLTRVTSPQSLSASTHWGNFRNISVPSSRKSSASGLSRRICRTVSQV